MKDFQTLITMASFASVFFSLLLGAFCGMHLHHHRMGVSAAIFIAANLLMGFGLTYLILAR